MVNKKLNANLNKEITSIPVFAQDGSIWIEQGSGLYRIADNEAILVLSNDDVSNISRSDVNSYELFKGLSPPVVIQDRIMVSRCMRYMHGDEIHHKFIVYIYSDKGDLLRKVPIFNGRNWLVSTKNAVFALGQFDVWILDADGNIQHKIEFPHTINIKNDLSACGAANNYIVFTRAEEVIPPGQERNVTILEDGREWPDPFSLREVMYQLFEDGRLEKIWAFEKQCFIHSVEILVAEKEVYGCFLLNIEREHEINPGEDIEIDEDKNKLIGCGMKMLKFREGADGKLQFDSNLRYGEWDNPIGPSINGKIGYSYFYAVSRHGNTILSTDYFSIDGWFYDTVASGARKDFSRLWIIPCGNDKAATSVIIPEPFRAPIMRIPPLLLNEERIMVVGESYKGKYLIATYFKGEWSIKPTPRFEYWMVKDDKVIVLSRERGRLWEL